MSIRVLLADDNTLFRLGLCSLLSDHEDCSVVAQAGSGREAVLSALRLSPDVVVMEVVLGGANGLDSVMQIKRHQPQVKVLMLTSCRTEEYVRSALAAGADGYVLKDASFDEVLMAIRSVARGKNYLSPDVSAHVVQRFLNPKAPGASVSRLEALTRRERTILRLVAEGRTNRGAAEYLNLSPKTVEKHRATLMHKLGLRNAAELTLAAVELGVIERPFAIARLTRDRSAGDLAQTAAG